MRVEFKKSIEAIDLGEYMPEMTGQVIYTWINPPMGKRIAYLVALEGAATNPTSENIELVYEKTAELLSQGAEETTWTQDEVRTLVEESSATDPQFWSWLIGRIVTAIETHRKTVKKN